MIRILFTLLVALLLSTGLSGACIAQDLEEISESIDDLMDGRGLSQSGELHDFEDHPSAEAPEEVVGARRLGLAGDLRDSREVQTLAPQTALLSSQTFRPPTTRP